MMKVKRWIEDGNAVQVDVGFLPPLAILFENTAGTNPNIYIYTKHWHDTESLNALLLTGSSGVVTRVTTAATGMDELDTVYFGVNLPNPAGGDDNFRIPEVWSTTADYSSTYTQSQTGNTVTFAARSTTAAGSVVYPPTRNGFVYELTTGTGAGTSEPSTWVTTPGETCTDGGSNVFTCRVENCARRGAQGVIVGATTQTDGQFSTLVAFDGINSPNVGDVANLTETDFA